MTDKPRVLFVDDEPNVLNGLRRTLHAMRDEWDMDFAVGGPAALAVLEQRPVDVVVSDMRMPGIDGAALLARIKASWPGVLRIVLSGFSEHEQSKSIVHDAQQYLRKPCDAATLKGVIGRSLALRSMLANPRVAEIVGRTDSLLTPPTLYHEITAALRDETRSVREIGDLVAQDVAMSAKVLQLVNSAFFGLPRRVAGPGEAAVLLGIEVLRALVVGSHVFSTIGETSLASAQLHRVVEHSMRVATLARRFATMFELGRRVGEDAFVAGFLHEVGKLVLLSHDPARYMETLQLAKATRRCDRLCEEDVFGAAHTLVGAYLLGVWGFPDTIVEAIAHMHQPSAAGSTPVGLLTALHLADSVEHDGGTEHPCDCHSLDKPYLESLGIVASVATWCEAIRSEPALQTGP